MRARVIKAWRACARTAQRLEGLVRGVEEPAQCGKYRCARRAEDHAGRARVRVGARRVLLHGRASALGGPKRRRGARGARARQRKLADPIPQKLVFS